MRYRARWRLIALDLSIDRAAMPAQGPSDRRWPESLPLQGRERMSLYRGELVVGPHESLLFLGRNRSSEVHQLASSSFSRPVAPSVALTL